MLTLLPMRAPMRCVVMPLTTPKPATSKLRFVVITSSMRRSVGSAASASAAPSASTVDSSVCAARLASRSVAAFDRFFFAGMLGKNNQPINLRTRTTPSTRERLCDDAAEKLVLVCTPNSACVQLRAVKALHSARACKKRKRWRECRVCGTTDARVHVRGLGAHRQRGECALNRLDESARWRALSSRGDGQRAL